MKSFVLSLIIGFLVTGCFGDVSLTEEEQHVNDRLTNPIIQQPDDPDTNKRLSLHLAAARLAEGSGQDNQQLLFAVNIDRPTTEALTINYRLENGLALAGRDFTLPKTSQITIGKGEHQGWIAVNLVANDQPEITRNMTVKLTSVNPDIADIVTAEAEGIIADDDDRVLPLTDTGSLGSINADGEYNAQCNGPYSHLLDCGMGKDVKSNSSADAARFHKLDNDGNVLAAEATSWACVRDNWTGLIWEAKQDIPFDQYHSIHSKFTVLNSRYFDWDESYHPVVLPGSDGILSGIPDTPTDTYRWRPAEGAEVVVVYTGSRDCAHEKYVCTSEQYALDINKRGLCGFNDWQVPEINQLRSLMSAQNNFAPDDQYFPFPGAFISHTPGYNPPAFIDNLQQIPRSTSAFSIFSVSGKVGDTYTVRILAEDIYKPSYVGDRTAVSGSEFNLMLVRESNE